MLTIASGKPMNQWTLADWEQFHLEQITNYRGDSYLVDQLTDTDEYTPDIARKKVRDLNSIKDYLEYDMLPHILADRTACMALKDAILESKADVIQALADAIKRLRVPRKRGPRPKVPGGQHLYQRIVLRDKDDLTWDQIARRVLKDQWTANHRKAAELAKSHYYIGKRRLAAAETHTVTPKRR